MAPSPETEWLDWDNRLAVVSCVRAFVLSPKRGWLSVNAADVLWDGRPVDPGDARDTFAEELVAFGDPPLSSDQADGKSTERQ